MYSLINLPQSLIWSWQTGLLSSLINKTFPSTCLSFPSLWSPLLSRASPPHPSHSNLGALGFRDFGIKSHTALGLSCIFAIKCLRFTSFTVSGAYNLFPSRLASVNFPQAGTGIHSERSSFFASWVLLGSFLNLIPTHHFAFLEFSFLWLSTTHASSLNIPVAFIVDIPHYERIPSASTGSAHRIQDLCV